MDFNSVRIFPDFLLLCKWPIAHFIVHDAADLWISFDNPIDFGSLGFKDGFLKWTAIQIARAKKVFDTKFRI